MFGVDESSQTESVGLTTDDNSCAPYTSLQSVNNYLSTFIFNSNDLGIYSKIKSINTGGE